MKTVDLFAGCGGLSLGFQNAGFDVVAAVENWPVAATCHRRNFTHPVEELDLSDVSTALNFIKKFTPEIIIGGPPCQDFSHAGCRIESTRASLTESFSEIITQICPAYFVMENVSRAQSSQAYQNARKKFKNIGYGLTEVVLNASYCGVPQRRRRFFCIGARQRKDQFLLKSLQDGLSPAPMTVRDYLGNSLGVDFYYLHPRNYRRRAIFSIDEPSPTIRGVNRPLPRNYQVHPNDAHTLDGNIRALTSMERALIQTFPVNFQWFGNKTELEQMIGNAVPVKLAEFVAQKLMAYIKKPFIDYEGFREWLDSNISRLNIRSRRDIVSRLRRVNSICPITNIPQDLYLLSLNRALRLSVLPEGINSQLKRAISLYYQYQNEK